MIRFGELSAGNIATLNAILVSAKLPRRDLVREAYLRRARHFDASLELLKHLGCISLQKDRIVVSPSFRDLLARLTDGGGPELKSFLVEQLIYSENPIGRPIEGFLALFDGQRELRASKSNRGYGEIRNFLIDLEFLHLDVGSRKYYIAPEYVLESPKPRQNCSPRRLKTILAERERIGHAAELAVLEFEKKRLCGVAGLASKIKHTAEVNAAAGFDILSFEPTLNRQGKYLERYIEVKAVARTGINFFVTRNEIETATRLRERYFLYLLPVVGNLVFDIANIRFVKDPATSIFADQTKWRQTVELVSFREVRPAT